MVFDGFLDCVLLSFGWCLYINPAEEIDPIPNFGPKCRQL